MSQQKRIRVLLAKPGLDGHDRGIIVVAMALRDAGMEVIYTGRHQTPDQIAQAAVQEDVDVVGLSSLADAHRVLAPRVVAKLRERERGDIPVILGGFIQPEDVAELKAAGVAEVFGSGSKLEAIVESIRGLKK
jgi:methylmalonyl-CoA mutase C-terminal domain/subunit